MDQFPPAIPAWLAGLFAVWFVLGAGVYSMVARLLMKGGGKVSVQEFKETDLVVCCAFIVWVGVNIVGGFGQTQKDVTQTDIVHGAATFVVMVGLLCLFLIYRGINPLRQFGVTRRNALVCLALALGLVMGAHPLIIMVEALTAAALHGQAEPQNVVEFFLNASQKSDTKAVWLMLLLAVIVAPVAEETVFRGYLYGVLKRYVGGIGAGLISAGLFAAMHLNVAALPALFVLALCLTVAYEATGSLLVNIFMHGLFNLSMLLMMLYVAGHPGVS